MDDTIANETTPAAEPESNDGRPTPPAMHSGANPPSALETRVVDVLRTCFDPEIPVNIYELGLIYEIGVVEQEGEVNVKMTLTSPMCPVAESLPPEIEGKVRAIREVHKAKVEVVWEPPWNPEMMSEAAKLQLGML